jgi:tRNA nucleotidyltransferase (CCA-adding enzyme)
VSGVRPAASATRGCEVLRALRAHAGGPELLALAEGGADLALVGGAVRDLLLGRPPRELDVVVAGDAAVLAEELASRVGTSAVGTSAAGPASAAGTASAAGPASASATAKATLHDRFGTAVLEWDGGRADIAERRAESYPAPGALPQVRPGTSEEDLGRRDFTVNAIAVALGGARRGELTCAEHALEDLDAGRLRVLHERSFIDDPTRLLRLARYRARLGFELEPETAALAAQALAAGALMTVSRARLGAELRLALAEADAPAALASMSEMGVLAALPAGFRFDRDLAERAIALLPPDGRADLLLMASLLLHVTMMPAQDPEPAIFAILDELEFTAADRERAMRSALAAPSLLTMTRATRPSELREALRAHTPEAIALAGALGGEDSPSAAAAAREWFERVRGVRLEINGEDLIAAGVPAGPEIGRGLAVALARKLDGELEDGREAELRAALDATVES